MLKPWEDGYREPTLGDLQEHIRELEKRLEKLETYVHYNSGSTQVSKGSDTMG